MSRQKRPFYIIGHNPNTIAEAKEFLENGANGLEPDVVHSNGQFYISHSPQSSYENVPTLEGYLQTLKTLIAAGTYNLALIIWDIKVTDFDINQFIAIVKANFSGGPCDGVTMIMTHSDDHQFISQYNGRFENVGVGVDESNIPPNELEEFFKNKGLKNFSYADGITTALSKPHVHKNIRKALLQRDRNGPESFKFIYTWVLAREAAMRKYLDVYVDGIFVDIASVDRIKNLLSDAPYNDAYQLAQNGYNPFTAPDIPRYLLTIKTRDKFLAGTNARFLFTLKGKSCSLMSLPVNAHVARVFERGSTTTITLEGLDVGEIESLTVEALTAGLGAAWLPEKITVEGKPMGGKVDFDFNIGDQKEWITKRRPVTAFPTK